MDAIIETFKKNPRKTYTCKKCKEEFRARFSYTEILYQEERVGYDDWTLCAKCSETYSMTDMTAEWRYTPKELEEQQKTRDRIKKRNDRKKELADIKEAKVAARVLVLAERKKIRDAKVALRAKERAEKRNKKERRRGENGKIIPMSTAERKEARRKTDRKYRDKLKAMAKK
jgi:hypothetical protein